MVSARKPYVILAAIAFDDTGVTALQEGARMAQQCANAELHLVHVVSEGLAGANAEELLALNARLAGAPDELQRRVSMLALEGPLKIIAHLRAGAPSTGILQTAADLDADLIVVGTRRRSGLEKLVAGSVAERVLHRAHCPVLVALPKDLPGAAVRDGVEPACAECAKTRLASGRTAYWCERHARSRLVMHLYEPSDAAAAPLMR